MKMKTFIKASPSSHASNTQENKNICNSSIEDGNRIYDYYLNVTNDSERIESDDEIVVCKEIKTTKSSNNDGLDREINKAMIFAQTNNVQDLKKMIDNGFNVNTTDEYGWSLLMVASCAGSTEVVKYLLNCEAKRGKRDVHGNTAIYLASRNNHTNIVNLLTKQESHVEPNERDFLSHPIDVSNIAANDNFPPLSYYCKECNVTTQCSRKVHETSIAHLFKISSIKNSTAYAIPRSNIGFQMLLNQGWEESQGLGPSGSGMKYPLKVKKISNRSGVGRVINELEVATNKRVEKERQLSVKSLNKNLSREKEKEKKFRKLLNDPDF